MNDIPPETAPGGPEEAPAAPGRQLPLPEIEPGQPGMPEVAPGQGDRPGPDGRPAAEAPIGRRHQPKD